ncbi:alpha/beta fold hydrolase [Sphaerisporangium sp. TRM90804]|uniref:alpha/beta fold hydrolase n=1 Tax=Sphaerisporangium sp. TRM90804 TaxID=3031113 RepID=UPI00244BCCA2|nr:alpha/beta fold hydrolase [Sphaerisporangium sp. TRM90804]MDH2427058.1 alpha/beta fold hydrolase [Sphaerisporangium sp. TRM90804]
MRLAYERRGEGPPLVLLHGIGHHRQAWRPVIDLLAGSRDVIAVDFPGFGASPGLPSGTPYNAQTLADAVELFCAELGVPTPHVGGNSLGGYVALTLAARGSVRTATALSPAGFWNALEHAYVRAALRGLHRLVKALPPDGMTAVAGSTAGRALSIGLVVARPGGLSPEAVVAAGRALRDGPGFDETLDSFRAVVPPSRAKVPITIAWGERDRLLWRRQAVRAARWSEQRVKLLQGCGHVPMSDDPGLVARVLLDGSRD